MMGAIIAEISIFRKRLSRNLSTGRWKCMKPRAVVGKGTGALLLLSRLPIRLRDRMVKSALGLGGALNPAG
jgi:hypothetical protein